MEEFQEFQPMFFTFLTCPSILTSVTYFLDLEKFSVFMNIKTMIDVWIESCFL